MLCKFLSTLSLSCIITWALEPHFILGVNSGLALVSIEQSRILSFQSKNSQKNIHNLAYEIKFGYEYALLEKHALRTYMNYSKASFKGSGIKAKDLKYDILGFNLDYRYAILKQVHIFTGLFLGANLINTKGEYANANKFSFGLNLGANYSLAKNLELEAKYRHFDSNSLEKSFDLGTRIINIRNFHQFLFGINYKF